MRGASCAGATLALAGRNKEALERLAGELGDRTHVITGDLGEADSADAVLSAATSGWTGSTYKSTTPV